MPALGRRVRRGRTQARTWLVLGCSPQLITAAASILPQHLPRGPSGPLPHCLLRTPLCTVGEAEARPFSHPQQCGRRNQSIKVLEPPKYLSHSFCTFSSCDQHLGSQHLVPHPGPWQTCASDGAQGLPDTVQGQLSLHHGYPVFTHDLFVHQAAISHLRKVLELK